MPAGDGIDWRFETDRMRARLVDSRDRDLYLRLYTDSMVMAHIGATNSEAEAIDLFGKVLAYNAETPVRARYWRLSDRSTEQAIGIQSFIRPVADPTSLELGMMLLPHSQGLGLGVEASQRFVDLLLGNHWGLGIETVFSRHAHTNLRVARLGAALGFSHMDRPVDQRAEQSVPLSEEWRLSRQQWLARGGMMH